MFVSPPESTEELAQCEFLWRQRVFIVRSMLYPSNRRVLRDARADLPRDERKHNPLPDGFSD
jgi:hypothetical protein